MTKKKLNPSYRDLRLARRMTLSAIVLKQTQLDAFHSLRRDNQPAVCRDHWTVLAFSQCQIEAIIDRMLETGANSMLGLQFPRAEQ